MSTAERKVREDFPKYLLLNSKTVLLDFSNKTFKSPYKDGLSCLLNSLRLATEGEKLTLYSSERFSKLSKYENEINATFKEFYIFMEFLEKKFPDVNFTTLPKKETLDLIKPKINLIRSIIQSPPATATSLEIKRASEELEIIETFVLMYETDAESHSNIIGHARTRLYEAGNATAREFICQFDSDPIRACNKFLEKCNKAFSKAKRENSPKIIEDFSEKYSPSQKFIVFFNVIQDLCLTHCFEHQPMDWNPSESPTKLFHHLVEHGTPIIMVGRFDYTFFKENSLKKVDTFGTLDVFEWPKGSRRDRVRIGSDGSYMIHTILIIGFDFEKNPEDPYIYYYDTEFDTADKKIIRMSYSEFKLYLNSFNIYDYDLAKPNQPPGSPVPSFTYTYSKLRTLTLTENMGQEQRSQNGDSVFPRASGYSAVSQQKMSPGDSKSARDIPQGPQTSAAEMPTTLAFSDDLPSRVEKKHLPAVIKVLQLCKGKSAHKYPTCEAALRSAAFNGKANFVEILLKCVKDLKVDEPGPDSRKTAIMNAKERNHVAIVDRLQKHLDAHKTESAKARGIDAAGTTDAATRAFTKPAGIP